MKLILIVTLTGWSVHVELQCSMFSSVYKAVLNTLGTFIDFLFSGKYSV